MTSADGKLFFLRVRRKTGTDLSHPELRGSNVRAMARSRQRACLQEGLRLDVNRLACTGYVMRGFGLGPRAIQWANNYTAEIVAVGMLTSDLSNPNSGSLNIQIGALDQTIALDFQPRHFGGGQWYFVCAKTGLRCSAVWMPPGARYFASRQNWSRKVAYSSQFQTSDRALNGARKIRTRLGGPDWDSIDEFDPPKPKWMRWRTYNRLIDRSRDYETIADESFLFRFIARWGAIS